MHYRHDLKCYYCYVCTKMWLLILAFLLELRTARCHFPQRADSCQKSLRNDTGERKRQNKPGVLQANALCFPKKKSFGSLLVGTTLVCALMKGNPTLHLRKSKSTSAQEIPFSSCKKTDRQRVRGDRQTGDRVGDTLHRDVKHKEEDQVNCDREQLVW